MTAIATAIKDIGKLDIAVTEGRKLLAEVDRLRAEIERRDEIIRDMAIRLGRRP